jgi:perosamine synthetase
MRKFRFPAFDIFLKGNEKKYVISCIKNSNITQGNYVNLFEKKFSKFINSKYGISTTSGTTALHLACKVLGLKSGDEVLLSSSTNMASAFAIDYCGAIPVPVDINIENWQMDVSQLENKINHKTKAIMVVHLFGHPVDMDPVLRIARKYNLKIIEDCAESPAVEYKKKKVGTFGDVSAFSFYANKTITTGEGGMLITNSKQLAEKARSLKNLGYGKIDKFLHEDIGFNYRLPNISAAIGLAQLENIDEIFKNKKRIYDRYSKNLRDIIGLNIPKIETWATRYIMWVYNIYLDHKFPLTRDQVVNKLKKYSIETRNAFTPVNYQRVFLNKNKNLKKSDCPNANFIMKNGFYLPSGNNIKNSQIDFICEMIKKLGKNKY